MVVDDSAVIRGLFTQVLESNDEIEVVESVGDGALALKALDRSKVDVVLLDIEMPNMDGLTALPQMIKAHPDLTVIMASSLRALRMGATDYVTKPSSRQALRQADDFKRDLVEKVIALGSRGGSRSGRRSPKPVNGTIAISAAKSSIIELRDAGKTKPAVLAIGSSTGGPQALTNCIKSITDNISLPILITQHMPPTFTAILANHLEQASGWPSAEGQDGEAIEGGRIYVAPGGQHMLVESAGMNKVIRLNDDPPENFCKPAVDPMLRSIVDAYGPAVLVLILTGMGADGCAGSKVVVEAGGTVVAQDEESSVVWGMPGAVATNGLCNAVLPLPEIGPKICRLAV
jgi:two-component system chemotaxis response regulator CheB